MHNPIHYYISKEKLKLELKFNTSIIRDPFDNQCCVDPLKSNCIGFARRIMQSSPCYGEQQTLAKSP